MERPVIGLAGAPIFRVQLRMRPRAGAGERFDAALADVGRVVAGNPDNVDQWILRSDEDGGVVYVFSDWVSEEAFRKHART
jgi:quinol monooxygenase YgiN